MHRWVRDTLKRVAIYSGSVLKFHSRHFLSMNRSKQSARKNDCGDSLRPFFVNGGIIANV